jgi:uncharacterized membrane protein YfcA
MEIGWELIALLALVGMLAGIIDSIAGGGGLLALPTILATGMPPLAALATNKLQSMCGTATATVRYAKAGLIEWRHMVPSIITTAIGAALGVVAVQSISQNALKLVIPVLLIAAVLYFLLSPRMGDDDAHQRLSLNLYAGVAGVIGLYDGFFGPGTGSFFAVSLVGLAGMGLTRATAHTKVLNLTSNIVAVALFAAGGHIIWTVGLAMSAGQIAGAWIGSHLAVRHGARVIRPLLILVSLGLTARLLLDPDNPLRAIIAG